jgi:hypothetical protein
MVKQSNPMNLATPLILVVAGLVVWNAYQGLSSGVDEHGHRHDERKQEEQVVGRKLTPAQRQQAKNELAGVFEDKERGPNIATLDQDATGNPTEPTILLPSMKSYKPTPNDASTATHWYRESSRSARIAEENKRASR